MAQILKGKKVVAEGDTVQECMWSLKRDENYADALVYPKTNDIGNVVDEIHVRFKDNDGEYTKVEVLTVEE